MKRPGQLGARQLSCEPGLESYKLLCPSSLPFPPAWACGSSTDLSAGDGKWGAASLNPSLVTLLADVSCPPQFYLLHSNDWCPRHHSTFCCHPHFLGSVLPFRFWKQVTLSTDFRRSGNWGKRRPKITNTKSSQPRIQTSKNPDCPPLWMKLGECGT